MKLLIADDEMQIRTGLAEGIDWEALGITEVITAENGIEALELGKEKKPEIILTDIRMPGINGLELGKQITEEYQPVVIIILSGYSDFEYAKEAIKMGAFDYLLKPINIENLIQRVSNAREEIAKKNLISKNSEIAEGVRKKEAIAKIIQSRVLLEGDEYKTLKNSVNLDFNKQMAAGICAMDLEENRRQEQMCIYMENQLAERMKELKGEILYRQQGRIFFLTEVFSEAEYERKREIIENQFENLNKILMNQFGASCTCTLSKSGASKEIPLLVESCEELLKHRLYLGNGKVLCRSHFTFQEQLTFSPVNAGEIQNHIAKFDYSYMQQYLDKIFEELREKKVTSTDFVKGVCLELKNVLISVVSERGVDVESILQKNEILLNEIPEYFILDKYHAWIDNLYFLILNGMSQLTGKQHNRAIVQAIDYIQNHYADDISLEAAAEYVNKSKNYFSYLFKKETGVSFIEYLNNTRVNQAKILLNSTDQMTYEISSQVGYNDYKYFSSIFKKNTGMSPAQYRRQGRE